MFNVFLFYFFPLALLVFSGICIALLAWIIMSFLGTNSNSRKGVFILIASVFITLSAAEELLRITGTYANYVEKKNHVSWSPYDYDHHNLLWNLKPFHKFNLSSDEFSFPRTANSLGFDDKEFRTEKDSNEIKILCLGDSFTEGDGASFDSSYPRQMERILQARYPDKKITVMNAGICASDPVFGFKDYDSLLYRFSPDIVIQSLAKQDFYEDIALRGGFDRFNDKNELQYAHPYRYEKLYKWSFLSRIYFDGILHLNMLFLNPQIVEAKGSSFKEVACQLSQKWDALIAKHNFKMYFVLRPDATDITNHCYDTLFSSVVSKMKACSHLATVADIDPFYVDSVHMDNDLSRYFWQKDGHHNSYGYYQMARATANVIAPF